MNKDAITKAVYFTAGLCIGGGVTYLVVKDRYKRLTEEEVASVRDSFEKIYERKARQLADDWNSQPDPEESAKTKEEYRTIVANSEYETVSDHVPEEAVAYIHTKDADVEVHSEDENFEVTVATESDPNPNKPYVIDVVDFMNNGDYDNITMTYWTQEDILVDEREEIIHEVDSLIGRNNLNFFDEHPNEDTVYIRNNKEEVDFEIIKDTRSYAQVVLGLKDGDSETFEKIRKTKRLRSDEEQRDTR